MEDDFVGEPIDAEQRTVEINRGFLDPYHLFPHSIRRGFTASPTTPRIHRRLIHVNLADKPLGVTKVSSGTTHDIIDDVPRGLPGTKAWKAVYPEGSINPGNSPRGGFGFYLAGPGESICDLSCATDVLFSYAVYFEPEFDFNLGGKLPGLYGGATPDIAYGCSGGRKQDRDRCFSLRLMWRRRGYGEIYAYLPFNEQNKQVLSNVPPKSKQNPDYGFSVGQGAFRFTPGEWMVIAQRVRLNDIGQANGEIDLWANGERVIAVREVIIREDSDCVVRGAHFQTFFGGNTPEWASPKTQFALFADVSGAIIR
ncbi:hypothetical protein FRB99_002834 [Tulasnella sp. 403]|nr:hypothetical protein FRB99_002834 [Tulasnella sp. 403]